jgi:hypothetical protein
VTAAHGAEQQQQEGGEGERTRGDAGGGLEVANQGEERGVRGERKVVSRGGGGRRGARCRFKHEVVPLAADGDLQSEVRATRKKPPILGS